MSNDRSLKIVWTVILALALGFFAQVSASPRTDNRVVINIPSRTLWVFSGDRLIQWFPVGVGRPGYMTPIGQFQVLRKVLNPGWEHPYMGAGQVRIAPGGNNPLGTRWIGFHRQGGGEYGMHGTDNPSSVGKFSSHGCVRLKVPDAEKLFELVEIGTPVQVIYEPVLIRPEGNHMRVIVYPDVFHKGMPTADAVMARIKRDYPNAVVDGAQLRQALAHPAQKPVVIGQVQADGPFASSDAIPAAPASRPAVVSGKKAPVPGGSRSGLKAPGGLVLQPANFGPDERRKHPVVVPPPYSSFALKPAAGQARP